MEHGQPLARRRACRTRARSPSPAARASCRRAAARSAILRRRLAGARTAAARPRSACPIANAGTLSVSTGTLAAPAGIDQSARRDVGRHRRRRCRPGVALGGGTLGGGGHDRRRGTNGGGRVDPAGTLRVTTLRPGPRRHAARRRGLAGVRPPGGHRRRGARRHPRAGHGDRPAGGHEVLAPTAGSTSGAFEHVDGLRAARRLDLRAVHDRDGGQRHASVAPPPPPPVDPSDPGRGRRGSARSPATAAATRAPTRRRAATARRARRRHGDDRRAAAGRATGRATATPACARAGQGAADRRAPQGPHGGDHPRVPPHDGGLPRQRDAASGGVEAAGQRTFSLKAGKRITLKVRLKGVPQGRAAGDGDAGALRSGPCVQGLGQPDEQ